MQHLFNFSWTTVRIVLVTTLKWPQMLRFWMARTAPHSTLLSSHWNAALIGWAEKCEWRIAINSCLFYYSYYFSFDQMDFKGSKVVEILRSFYNNRTRSHLSSVVFVYVCSRSLCDGYHRCFYKGIRLIWTGEVMVCVLDFKRDVGLWHAILTVSYLPSSWKFHH